MSEKLVNNLAKNYLIQHSRAQLSFAKDRMLLNLGALSETQVKEYNTKFDAFENRVEGFFRNLHDRVRLAGRAVIVPYELQNESGISAQGLRIECSVTGPACLLAARDESPHYVSFSLP